MAAIDNSQTAHRPAVPEWLRAGESRLRLQTMVRLRWLAVLGQSITVVGAYWVLGIDLPIGWCFAVIALSAWLNVALRIRSAFLAVPMPEALAQAIVAAVEVLGADKPLAVRSSAPGEDSANRSFAGLHESVVGVVDIEAVLDIDETNHLKYVKHGFDCENFAALLWGQFNTPAWAKFAIGLMWTDAHGMVNCIDANGDLWLIEPQSDERRSDLLAWQGYKMRFTII